MIKNNPSSETVWRQSADAARRRGDLKTALGYYEQALALNPDRARLYYSKAIIHDELGHKSETEEALRRAVTLNPEDSYALNYLRVLAFEKKGAIEMKPLAISGRLSRKNRKTAISWTLAGLGVL